MCLQGRILTCTLSHALLATAEDFSNIEVRVGGNAITSSNPPSRNGNFLCAALNNPAGNSGTSAIAVSCSNPYGIHGQYVSIQKRNFNGTTTPSRLTLCEVLVFTPTTAAGTAPPPASPPPTGLEELASGRPTGQSSVMEFWDGSTNVYTSARAVDGVTLQDATAAPYCARTTDIDQPWWWVAVGMYSARLVLRCPDVMHHCCACMTSCVYLWESDGQGQL